MRNKAFSQLLRRPTFWLAVVLVPALLSTMLVLLIFWIAKMFPVVRALSGGLLGGLIGGTLFAVLQFVFRQPLRKLIWIELAARGVPVCTGCGDDLRGQASPRCPECDAEFDAELLNRSAAENI